ncbi:mechanosensitive ion channel domain-containing protein [Segnochrobactrum spirostomi]|uniref:Mechanosensitive ion channel n=1 Tax=Segnochrobactrum spirostomi TaxID=2608987 RepID=A0A6A7Y3F2_9HYPH|nr:mechanosensitive ion channel domain-containing protein [Segnochrobactrum spirostomi]MQT13286.1 mechanosensitive ion channel [Segnochrobactrum spirostomi]
MKSAISQALPSVRRGPRLSSRFWAWLAAVTVFVVVAGLFGGIARAQAPTAVAPAASAVKTSGSAPADAAAKPTADEIDAALKILQDDKIRATLISQLETLRTAAAATAPPAQDTSQIEMVGSAIVSYAGNAFAGVKDATGRLQYALQAIPALGHALVTSVTDPVQRASLVALIAIVFAAVGLGAVAWHAVNWLITKPREALALRGRHAAAGVRLMLAAVRVVLDLLPIAAFVAIAFATLGATKPTQAAEALALTIINAVVVSRVIGVFLRMVLAPTTPALRSVPLDDATAKQLFDSAVGTVALAVWGYFVLDSLYLFGLPPIVRWGLLFILGIVIAIFAIRFVWRWRKPFSRFLNGHVVPGRWDAPLARTFADFWHLVATLFILLFCSVFALQIAGGATVLLRGVITTLVVVNALFFLSAWLGRVAAKPPQPTSFFASLRGRQYRKLIFQVLTVALWAAAALLVLQGWKLHAIEFLLTQPGRVLLRSISVIATVSIGGLVVSEFANAEIEKRLRASEGNVLSARARTLLAFLRNIILVAIGVMVVLISLSELGIDIAPLLAGAGVIGLAIGFGAQTLVKDIITGIFILLEDQIQVDDVVDLGGGFSGSVEAMTIRTIRLRDETGTLQVIPFSSVTGVRNMTRGFAYSVFNIAVGYAEDVDRILALIGKLAAELKSDPKFGPLIAAQPEILGVDSLTETGYVVKGRFKTYAGRQWSVSREFNRRVKRLLDDEGIDRPSRRQTYTYSGDPNSVPPATVSAEAEEVAALANGEAAPMEASEAGKADGPAAKTGKPAVAKVGTDSEPKPPGARA